MLEVESTVPGLNRPLPPLLPLGLRIRRRNHDLVQQLDTRHRDAVLDQVSRSGGSGRDRREGRNRDGRRKEGCKFERSCRFDRISGEDLASVDQGELRSVCVPSVTMPSVPSAPMNRRPRSGPTEDFLEWRRKIRALLKLGELASSLLLCSLSGLDDLAAREHYRQAGGTDCQPGAF